MQLRARLFAAVAALAMAAGPAAAAEVSVFAAASLKNAMDEIAAGYAAETGGKAVVTLAGSSALARQIEQGAPADVFISANPGWMDELESQGMVEPGSRFDLVSNSIVLIAHDADIAPVAIGPDTDLAGMLGDRRLAMALVDAVPAGVYGKAALESLGLWEKIAPQVAQADNVRAALALVATGEAPLGVVYATDAVAEDRVTVIGTFPASSHPPIVYPAAAIAGRGAQAAAFLDHLRSPAARAALERQGFVTAAE